MAVPVLSQEQRVAASAKATQIRIRRKDVKAQLKNKQITFVDLLKVSEQDEIIAGMKVKSVLEALPAFGKVKAATLMKECGIADTRRIKGLGLHQAQALLNALKTRAEKSSPKS